MTLGGARQLGRYGINMNCVSPGNVLSPMTEWFLGDPESEMAKERRDQVVFGYIGDALDIVPAIVFLCSDLAHWIVGADLNISAGQVIY
jgi:NAD(P)-dependent dehydrogenase (short-subunit alcohol dehydrogenase family)